MLLIKKKIVVNDTSLGLLKRYGLSLDSVPNRGETIYLQTASNVMLGGETTDVTEEVPVYFKDIASKTATLFDAFICGVDIIIPDLTGMEYAVLEINDNPGMYISEVPYEGKERRLGQIILKELGLY